MLEKNRPACTGFVCDNLKLQEFIEEHTDPETAGVYRKNINAIREVPAESDKNSVILKKESLNDSDALEVSDREGAKLVFVGILVVGLFMISIVMIRRRRD